MAVAEEEEPDILTSSSNGQFISLIFLLLLRVYKIELTTNRPDVLTLALSALLAIFAVSGYQQVFFRDFIQRYSISRLAGSGECHERSGKTEHGPQHRSAVGD